MNQDIAVRAASQTVEHLETLGIKPPAPLVAALALHRAASAPPAKFNISAEVANVNTPADIEALYKRAAASLAHAEAAAHVLTDLRVALARRITTAHTDAGPSIVDALRPHFEKAADRFQTAYRALPPGWDDSNVLVRSGPDVVAAWHQALDATSVLDSCATIRRAIPRLDANAPVATGTLYCDVTDTMVAEAVANTAPGSLGRWGAILSVPGVAGLRWRTPTEHKDYIATLPHAEIRHERHGIGTRPVKVLTG